MTITRISQYKVSKFTAEYKHGVYKQAYERMINKINNGDFKTLTKDDVFRLLHLSIKIIETMPNEYTLEDLYYYERVMNMMQSFMQLMTIKELKQYYPIEKTYNGAKCGCNDYYSTMKALAKYDENEMIGNNIDKILWKYFNPVIMDAHVNMLMIISNKNRMEGKQGLAEKIAQKFQMPMYEKQENGSYKEVWQKPNLTLITNE